MYVPSPGFTFSPPLIIIIPHTDSHPNVTSFSTQIRIHIPHVTWSGQEVRESRIDHTNANYPHNAEPEERNSEVDWH